MVKRKRVVLKRIHDVNYAARYDLRVMDGATDLGIIAGVHTLSGDEFEGHLILMMQTPRHVRFRSFPEDKPIGVSHSVRDANRRLYEHLKKEAEGLIRATNGGYGSFQGYYDETGMGKRYTRLAHVKGKTVAELRGKVVVA